MIVFSFNCSFFPHFVPLKNESFADISVTGHHDMLYAAPVIIGEKEVLRILTWCDVFHPFVRLSVRTLGIMSVKLRVILTKKKKYKNLTNKTNK